MQETERKFMVYKHTSPDGKIYIGMTVRILEGRSGRKGAKYKKNQNFWNAIQNFGWENFTHEVLYENLEETQAQIMERSLIHFYKSNNPEFGYNSSEGGELSGTMNKRYTRKPLSDEAKQSVSKGLLLYYQEVPDARLRNSESHKGIKQSQEQIEKRREKLLGHDCSTETRHKIGNALKGKKRNDEQRNNISKGTSFGNWYSYRFGKRRKPILMIEYKYISL